MTSPKIAPLDLEGLEELERRSRRDPLLREGAWRVERVHDLWVQIEAEHGLHRSMKADCLDPRDAELIVALRNSAPQLLAYAKLAREAREIIKEIMDPEVSTARAHDWIRSFDSLAGSEERGA